MSDRERVVSDPGDAPGTIAVGAGDLHRITVDGLRVAYRDAGHGPTVLFVHGWPTSSFLWRDGIAAVTASGCRALAPDLPGFGDSDKPVVATYTLDFQARFLDRFLDRLEVGRTSLVVHDLGGPIGLLWAVRNSSRLERLVLLDTLVYPRRLPLLRALLGALRLPGIGPLAVRPRGLGILFRLGRRRLRALECAAREAYLAPYCDGRARGVLLRTLLDPRFDEFDEIHAGLDRLAPAPTLIAWADRDLLLSRSEMRRLHAALPRAETTTIARAGHFLTEDQPQAAAGAIAAFLAP